jgi:hypothetical protein
VAHIVAGINAKRGLRPFTALSDILSVTNLTSDSPFLFSAPGYPEFTPSPPRIAGDLPKGDDLPLRDSDYERIPQQILGLLKVGEPRFVIYAWGQSLKPARYGSDGTGPSITTAGPDRGQVNNYQITGEMATRAVVRVEFDPNPRFDLRTNAFRLDYSRPHLVVESFNILPNE